MSSEQLNASAGPELALYRRRFAVLALLCLGMMTNAIVWVTFAPVNTLTQSFYGVSATSVNALSVVFLAVFVPVSFLTNYVFDRFGVRNGMLLAALCNALSGLVRWLSTTEDNAARGDGAFAILMLGQALGAFAQPFMVNLPARIGSLWFPENQRDLATVVGALSNPIGAAIGSVLPTLYASESAGTIRMYDLLLMQLGLVAGVFALVLVGFQERPPLPPTLSQHKKGAAERQGLRRGFRLVLGNRQYQLLMLVNFLGVGFYFAVVTLVEQLVSKAGYSSRDAGTFSAVMLGAGVMSAVVSGGIMNKTHAYNPLLRGFVLAFSTAMVGLLLALRPGVFGGLCAAFAAVGVTMMPVLPIIMQCAAECTYPLNEDISTGGLMSTGRLGGILFVFVLGSLLDAQPEFGDAYVFEPAYIMSACFVVPAVAATFVYSGEYKRLHADRVSSADLTSANLAEAL